MLGNVYYSWIVNKTNIINSGFGLSSFLYSFSTVGIATVKVNVSNTIDRLSEEFEISVLNGEHTAGMLVSVYYFSSH